MQYSMQYVKLLVETVVCMQSANSCKNSIIIFILSCHFYEKESISCLCKTLWAVLFYINTTK